MQETQETQVQSLDGKDPLEEGMATNSSILAWKIPWTEESGRLLPGVLEDLTDELSGGLQVTTRGQSELKPPLVRARL